MPLDLLVARAFGLHGRSYTAFQTPFFQLTGLESLHKSEDVIHIFACA